jgi:hypothetical protein
MAITVGENSYINVADADSYFADRLFSDEWTNATAGQKEQGLKMATKKIDRQQIRGIKADDTQSLEFPRALYSNSKSVNPFYDPLKNSIETTPGWVVETAVTQEVKDATCEEAMSILQGGKQARKRAQLQAQGVKSFILGSLSESFAGGSQGNQLISVEAQELLQPYLSGGRHIV